MVHLFWIEQLGVCSAAASIPLCLNSWAPPDRSLQLKRGEDGGSIMRPSRHKFDATKSAKE
jgi:hypothetical protein